MSDNSRNRVYSKAGLAEGTNANTFKTAAPNGAGIDYSIKGVMYHKADTDNLDFSTGHTAVAPYQICVFGVFLDKDGNVTTRQGPIRDISSSAAVSDSEAVTWPAGSDDLALIGGIVIETANTTFTPRSTDLSAASVTETYIDVDGLPPQAAVAGMIFAPA